MKTLIYFLSFLGLFLTGCSTYHVVRPMFPETSNPHKEPGQVSSLQPLLSWEPSDEIAVSYDIIIFEVIVDSSTRKVIKRTPGARIYYRENLFGNSHVVQAVLKPDTEYCWSLRIRKGDRISEWASYDYRSFMILDSKINDSYYRFKTPYMRPTSFRAFDPLDHW